MWLEVEPQVKTWILEQRQTGISVSTKMTGEEGRRIAREKTLVVSQGRLHGASAS